MAFRTHLTYANKKYPQQKYIDPDTYTYKKINLSTNRYIVHTNQF